MPEKTTADQERSERAEALIARMKKARGYIYPE
jgi:hypothetical protein